MYCTRCGAPILPGDLFCSKCGQKLEFTQNSQQYNGQQYNGQQYSGQQYSGQQYSGQQYSGQQYSGQQYNGQQYSGQQYGGQQYNGQQYNNQMYAINTMPMTWHKFLINFSLWAAGILNILSGTGLFLGTTNYNVYKWFDELEIIDKLFGTMWVTLGVFLIITRFKVARFQKNGPIMLLIMYIASGILGFGYNVLVLDILSDVSSYFGINMSFYWGRAIGGLIGSGVIAAINFVYYNKRRHLFIY
jgi:hypothetical protein